MRRAKTTLLAVAVAMCLAALLTPVASATKPPPFTITQITITGTGTQVSTLCEFTYRVYFVGRVHHGDYATFRDSNSSTAPTLGLDHATGSFGTTADLPLGDFESPNTEFSFKVSVYDQHGVLLDGQTTPAMGATTSCPAFGPTTYTYSP